MDAPGEKLVTKIWGTLLDRGLGGLLRPAQIKREVARFRVGDFVFRGAKEYFDEAGLTLRSLLELDSLGILRGVEATVAGMSWSPGSTEKNTFRAAIGCNNMGLVIDGPNPAKGPDIAAYIITKLGIEVLSLGSFETDEKYLRFVAEHIKKQGFGVQIGDVSRSDQGEYHVVNLKAI